MAENEEGTNTPQNDPFTELLEGQDKPQPKPIDLQKVDILSGAPVKSTPQIESLLPGSPLFSVDLTHVYPRSLQRYAKELKPDQWQLGSDWEQSMAKNQSWTAATGRGAKNMAKTFWSTAVETIASPFVMAGGSWDSEYWRDMDKWRADAKAESPIYGPEGYDDMGPGERAGTVKFWADEFLEGIGFFTGALAGGMASSGVYGGGAKTLLNPRLLKNVARGGRRSIFRALAKGGAQGADDVTNGISRSVFLKEGLKNLAKQAGTKLGKSNLFLTSMFAARAEAAVEARDVLSSVYNTLEGEYMKENNISDPSNIPGVVKNKFKLTATALGNAGFATNVAILTLTNAAMFKLLGIGGRVGSRSIGTSIIGRYLNTPVRGGVTRLQQVLKVGPRTARNMRRVGRLVQGATIESVGQEYPQYMIQDASVNYAVDRHFGGNTKPLSEHYMDSAINAWSDPHGQTAIALGALISIFGMGGAGVASKVVKSYSTQGQKVDANIEELLKLVRATKFSEKAQQTNNVNAIEKNMLEANSLWEQGENKLAQNARDRAVAAYVRQLMQFEGGVGNLNATMDEIEKDLTDEQFAEMVGQPLESLLDEDGKIPMETRQEYTNSLKSKAKELSKIYKNIQSAFPNLATPNRVQNFLASEEDQAGYKEEVAIQEWLKQQLYFSLAGSHLSG